MTYKSLVKEYDKGIIGYAGLAVIAQSCYGSTAAMFLLNHSITAFETALLFLIIIGCMGFNVVVIAQQKGKVSIPALIISFVISTLCLIYSLSL